jgi:hypothetical protein
LITAEKNWEKEMIQANCRHWEITWLPDKQEEQDEQHKNHYRCDDEDEIRSRLFDFHAGRARGGFEGAVDLVVTDFLIEQVRVIN